MTWEERQDELVDRDEDKPLVCADCGTEWFAHFYTDECPNCAEEAGDDRVD